MERRQVRWREALIEMEEMGPDRLSVRRLYENEMERRRGRVRLIKKWNDITVNNDRLMLCNNSHGEQLLWLLYC